MTTPPTESLVTNAQSDSGSVTNWLRAMEGGDEDAARHLWTRYADEMRNVARRRLRWLKRHDVMDDEDIVISAFATLCLAARKGQLSTVRHRHDLWGLMVVTTLQKIGQRGQYLRAAKRNGDLRMTQAEIEETFGSRMERLVDDKHGPESQLLQAEQIEHLLAKLPSAELRTVAVLRLAGHTNDEIAAELGYTRRTIQRMRVLIRDCWASEKVDLP